MPIYKKQDMNSNTSLWVWHITEEEANLSRQLILTQNCINRLKNMRHSSHRKGFLAVRCLLRAANIPIHKIHYSTDGKPYMKQGPFLSFSHSKHFAAIAIGNVPVGVDVEQQRDKIVRIAKKFVNPIDKARTDTVAALTDLWCVKEAMYKMISVPGIRLNKDISVDFKEYQKGMATYKDQSYHFFHDSWSDYSCALTIKEKV
jgi:4'-phosphopantetheinyl transferase